MAKLSCVFLVLSFAFITGWLWFGNAGGKGEGESGADLVDEALSTETDQTAAPVEERVVTGGSSQARQEGGGLMLADDFDRASGERLSPTVSRGRGEFPFIPRVNAGAGWEDLTAGSLTGERSRLSGDVNAVDPVDREVSLWRDGEPGRDWERNLQEWMRRNRDRVEQQGGDGLP